MQSHLHTSFGEPGTSPLRALLSNFWAVCLKEMLIIAALACDLHRMSRQQHRRVWRAVLSNVAYGHSKDKSLHLSVEGKLRCDELVVQQCRIFNFHGKYWKKTMVGVSTICTLFKSRSHFCD